MNFRLQNFRFDNGIFWTSASKTISQKIKRWVKGDHRELCNTSDGDTIEDHGQYISKTRVNGKYVPEVPENLNDFHQYKTYGYLQGIWEDSAVFGSPNKEDIVVVTGDTKVFLKYPTYSKWYWKYWEAEGICKDTEGNLWIGISVKTYFGNILNYRLEIK